jgi:hypothetical protein
MYNRVNLAISILALVFGILLVIFSLYLIPPEKSDKTELTSPEKTHNKKTSAVFNRRLSIWGLHAIGTMFLVIGLLKIL